MMKIEHSKLFWTTLVGKDWEKCEITKIGPFQIIFDHFGGKRWEKVQNNWTQPEINLNSVWTQLNLNSTSIGTEFTC